MSWGLMQVMGQVARENGFTDHYLSGLCDPAAGVDLGCRVLRKKLDAAKGDTAQGLLLWNGGANPNYPVEVLARRTSYLRAAG
jgi:soluble lytic murein transglycosylase-like protein